MMIITSLVTVGVVWVEGELYHKGPNRRSGNNSEGEGWSFARGGARPTLEKSSRSRKRYFSMIRCKQPCK